VLVRIVCSPGGDALEATHQFIERYSQSRFANQIAQRVSLATYELLANAFNFGLLSADVTIELLSSDTRIEVRVTNDAIAARISMLTAHLEKLKHDAGATMLDEMRRSVGGLGARAMLGLARVAHEATFDLSLAVDGRRVTVSASGRV
jgi:anti-sigma regulatory factor (Ser/Thr protein kinase)